MWVITRITNLNVKRNNVITLAYFPHFWTA